MKKQVKVLLERITGEWETPERKVQITLEKGSACHTFVITPNTTDYRTFNLSVMTGKGLVKLGYGFTEDYCVEAAKKLLAYKTIKAPFKTMSDVGLN